MKNFSYAEFTTRNLGFVDELEQEKLRTARIFVCGVGGMGGACVQSLVRSGVGQVAIADFDEFDVSNLNRQVFSNMDTVGRSKVVSTMDAIKQINPEIVLQHYGRDWVDQIDTILTSYKLVINGMDDVRAGVHLYRRASELGATVIDAYTSPLPSVTCVKPEDPRPEQRLNAPTAGRKWQDLSDQDVAEYVLKEMEYVLTNSSSAKHIHLDYAVEMLNGERSRMSFAPMVITTGNLMCYEAVKFILHGKEKTTNHLGYFFNPFSLKIEKPRPRILRTVIGFMVRRYIRKLMNAA